MRAVLSLLPMLWLLAACSRPSTKEESGRPADLRAARCLGPADAQTFAVYLHGVDSAVPSDQEVENRRVLARVAAEMRMRIALPRAGRPCAGQPGSDCWSWDFQQADLDATRTAVRDAAAECFGSGKPHGLIGFSNGGYVLTRQYLACQLREASWTVTVGAGMLNGPLGPPPTPLQTCGTLVSLVGTEDRWNFDPEEGYVRALQARGAAARTVRYPGGHSVEYEPLRKVLGELSAGR